MAGPWDNARKGNFPMPAPGVEDEVDVEPTPKMPWEKAQEARDARSPTAGAEEVPEPDRAGRYITTPEDEARNYNTATGGSLSADKWRAFGQGVNSWTDEMLAAAQALPEAIRGDKSFWDSYDQYVRSEREKLGNVRRFDDSASGLEGLGTVASILSPALFYDRLRKAGVGVKTSLGLTGGGSGAVYGSGSADVDPSSTWTESADQRGRAAAAPMAIGAILGPTVGALGEKIIAPSVDMTRKAIDRTKNPEVGAYAKMAEGLPEGGVDALFGSIAQTDVQKRALRIMGEEMVAHNGDQKAAEAAMLQRIVSEHNVKPGTAVSNWRDLKRQMKDSRLFFAELPSIMEAETRYAVKKKPTIDEVRGITDNDTHYTFDMLANKGVGRSGRDTRNAISDRAGTANAHLAKDVQKMSPGNQTIEDVADKISKAEKAASADYARVHDPANNLVDIPRLHGEVQAAIDKHRNTWADRGGEQKAALDDALKEFDTVLPDGQRVIMPTLQQAQDMRGALRGIITRNVQSGNKHIVQALQPLYDDVTLAMRNASPEWGKVNDKWADKAIQEKTNELGEAFSNRAGPQYREQLAQYEAMAPELQDIVKINFLQKMKDELDNAVRTGNPARFFSSNHDIKAIDALFGQNAAVDFSRRLRDYNVEEMSKGMTKGSPTHRRMQSQKLGDTEESLVSAAKTGNIDGWRQWLFETAKNLITERRDRELARIGTTPANDIPRVAEHLQRMRSAPEAYKGSDVSPEKFAKRLGRGSAILGSREKAQEDAEKARLREGRAAGGSVEQQRGQLTGEQPPPFEPWVMWSQENYDPKMSQPRDMENFRPFQKPPLKLPPIPQEDKDRLRELLRQDGEHLRQNRPDLFEDEVLPPGSNLNLGDEQDFMGMAEGGVAPRPYDYSPDDDFSSIDMAQYLAGRALRRDGTAGIGNQAAARFEAYRNDEPAEDVLRRYREIDDAFSEDYPWTAGFTDTGAAIAGGVLGGGAMKASGSLAQRFTAAPFMWDKPAHMAVASGAASLGDTYLNEPDATMRDYTMDAALPMLGAVPAMYGIGKGIDVASDLLEGDVYKKLFRKPPKESQAEWNSHDLGSGPLGKDFDPELAGAPKVYQKSADHYYPDMPDMPANPIHKPTGKGYDGPSTATDRDAEFFQNTYEDLGEIPEHITKIRQNSTHRYINEKGRYIPLSDAMIYERLKKKGLLGNLRVRRAPEQSSIPKKPKS
jgi:hypothetical protein